MPGHSGTAAPQSHGGSAAIYYHTYILYVDLMMVIRLGLTVNPAKYLLTYLWGIWGQASDLP